MLQYSGVLQVNLSAIRKNWRILKDHFKGEDCGAVVKTNAYGLGVTPVAQALYAEGCQSFFVANFDEGIELRRMLPEFTRIFVLQGCAPNMEHQFIEYNLIPVLVSLPMYRRWQQMLIQRGPHSYQEQAFSSSIKVNTGMNRLGMSVEEFKQIAAEGDGFKKAGVQWLISHLACADEPDHPLNLTQRIRFDDFVAIAKQQLPDIKASLVNSAGIFLGPEWQFDVARPGIGLYGGSMTVAGMPRIHCAVTLSLPVLQVRPLDRGETVGYGATFTADRPMHIAIVAGGYGDGVLRSLSGLTFGWFHQSIPLLGRISMDSCVFDVSALSDAQRPTEGDLIEVIGPNCPIDTVAQAAGTISYELLTRLGDRLEKHYCE